VQTVGAKYTDKDCEISPAGYNHIRGKVQQPVNYLIYKAQP